MTSPAEIVGTEHVEGLRVSRGGAIELIETPLILRSIGYHGSAIDGLPHDAVGGVVPNEHGRVVGDGGEPITGVYVTGWIKRGPRGVIGTNRTCAQETVAQLWQDFADGALTRDVAGRDALRALLTERGADPVDWTGWRAIDAAERSSGTSTARPRVKFVAIDDMLAAARS